MKRHLGRWIAGVVAGALLVPGLIVLDVHRRAGATLDRHRAEVEAAWAELRARSAERPVVLGEPEEGNSWELYRQAFAGLQKMTTAEKEAVPEIDGTWEPDKKPDDAAIAAIYKKYEAELDLLRRGMRRREVDPGVEPEVEFNFPELSQSFSAARFLRGLAGLFQRQGNHREAVRAGLTGLVLGQDIGRRSYLLGTMIQKAHEDIAFDGLRDVLASHDLGPDALSETASILDRLSAARAPWLEAIDWEDVYTRKCMLDFPSWEKAFPLNDVPPRPGWRQLYSDRVMRAQTLNVISEWLAVLRRTRGRSPQEEGRLVDEASALAESSPNPLARAFLPPLGKVCTRDRASLLGYRLCRLAVALAWFEAEKGRGPASLEELAPRFIPAVPVCPLTGTAFRYAPGKVWSVGKDGKDDGGKIDESYGYDPEREGADAVWFVKRK